jgi:hypothetical protein
MAAAAAPGSTSPQLSSAAVSTRNATQKDEKVQPDRRHNTGGLKQIGFRPGAGRHAAEKRRQQEEQAQCVASMIPARSTATGKLGCRFTGTSQI